MSSAITLILAPWQYSQAVLDGTGNTESPAPPWRLFIFFNVLVIHFMLVRLGNHWLLGFQNILRLLTFFQNVIGCHTVYVHNYSFEGFKFLPVTRIDRHYRGVTGIEHYYRLSQGGFLDFRRTSPQDLMNSSLLTLVCKYSINFIPFIFCNNL